MEKLLKKLSTVCYEELILLSDSRLIKNSSLYVFSVIVAIWDNFLGLKYKHT